MRNDLGGRLRHFRQRAGLSLEKVAIELGLSARTIGDWERNYHSPQLAHLLKLATLYGTSITSFIPEEITAGVA